MTFEARYSSQPRIGNNLRNSKRNCYSFYLSHLVVLMNKTWPVTMREPLYMLHLNLAHVYHYLITLQGSGVGVVAAVAMFPRKVGDKEGGVEDEADRVI